MKLVINRIHYKIRCEIDGCSNWAVVGISGREGRPYGRLHLCGECLSQLVQMGAEVGKPPRSPMNIFKKALHRGKGTLPAPMILKGESTDETGYRV